MCAMHNHLIKTIPSPTETKTYWLRQLQAPRACCPATAATATATAVTIIAIAAAANGAPLALSPRHLKYQTTCRLLPATAAASAAASAAAATTIAAAATAAVTAAASTTTISATVAAVA